MAYDNNAKIVNSFSVFVVAQAKTTHEIDSVSTSFTPGTSGQKYLIFPAHSGSTGLAGVGISMGTNGISFYEHANSHMPATLVYQATLTKPLVFY